VDNGEIYQQPITFVFEMNFSRKGFLKTAGVALLAPETLAGAERKAGKRKPVVISTWNFGLDANKEAWRILGSGGSALDAVEAGVKVPEADPKINSVGYGGFPDRDGRVTLDSSIMDHQLNCGSVACLEHIMHPSAVARQVMENTPHVMLVGEGALKFALSRGFKKANLLTAEAEAAWKKWLEKSEYKPAPNWELNHDTIGMLALDSEGRLAGLCTTSGLAWKMHGRVGDSPIIGAGLYVDGEVGAATCTGLGEEMIRIAAAHSVVEAMRHGASPQKACEQVMKRLNAKRGDKLKDSQVAFLAMDKHGRIGAFSLVPGFEYAETDSSGATLRKSDYLISEAG
jgi:N4-(beta-N-acetylglucosaminyl)-L-asparaginase